MAAKRFLIFLFILCLFLATASAYAQPSFPTTPIDPPFKYRSYYPAPYGEFTTLRLFPQAETACGGTTGVSCPQIYGALGDPCTPLGKIYFNQNDNRLYSCNRDVTLPVNALGTNLNWGFLPTAWKQEGNNVFLISPNPKTFVGIGTGPNTTPFKLTIANGGGIIAAGTFGQGQQYAGSDGFESLFLWYPRRSSLRAGAIENNPLRVINENIPASWQDARIGDHSIVFGFEHEVGASHSAALGGQQVTIGFNRPGSDFDPCAAASSPTHSVVIMGQNMNNTGIGNTSTNIYCGAPHSVVIAEGNIETTNLVTTPSDHSVLFSGNITNSHHATILGGTAENAPFAFIGREITDNDPTSPTLHTAIINDLDIPLQNTHQTILASHGSIRNSSHAFLGSGSSNTITDSYFSAILGGQGNTLSDNALSIILGGQNNTASGGVIRTATGDTLQTIEHTFIGGGQNNMVFSDYSIVVGGQGNRAGSLKDHPLTHATHTAVVGGKDNKAWGHFSFIGGGLNNFIGTNDRTEDVGRYSVIIGGQDNRILGNYSFIGGGKNNVVNGHYSVIEGGENITVNGNHSWAFGRNVTVNGNNSWVFGYTENASDPITVNDDNVFIISNQTGSGVLPIVVGFNINPPAPRPTVPTLDVNLNVTAESLIVRSATGPGGDQLYLEHQTIWPTQEFFPLGKDLAEIFPASEKVSPGDVLIIADTDELALKKSRSSYNPKVVGVVSTAPALILEGERIVADFSFTDNETLSPPVALAGQVPCKVSLENGPIAYGDLLTTSSTPGHAMKATDQSLFFGTILGKALEPFNDEISSGSKTGLIKILVTLQ
jgi:hypothetical protein